MLEELVINLDLEILNECTGPATFVSDMGDCSWIDITPASRSLAASVVEWRVESDFFTGSDHRPIRFGVDSTALRTEVFRCKAWNKVAWNAFSMAVAQGCLEEGLTPQGTTASQGNSVNDISAEEQAIRLMRVL